MPIQRSTVCAIALALSGAQTISLAQDTIDATEQEPQTPVVTVIFDSGDISTIDSFQNNSAELNQHGLTIMRSLFARIAKYKGITQIEVTGHTSSRGPAKYNQELSEQRAATVARLLTTRYPDAQMRAFGMGETNPVTDNDTPEGEARNRRVEVKIKATALATD